MERGLPVRFSGEPSEVGRSTVAPSDQTTMRRANLALVLRYINDHGPCPRSAIAAGTGLNKATLTSLAGELQDRGLVMEQEPHHQGARGRPGRPLALDGSRVGALGFEINVDYIATHVIDLSGRVLLDRRIGFDAMGSAPEQSIGQLIAMIREAVEEIEARGIAVAGICVAVPGLIDSASGTVVRAPNLGWQQVRLKDMLSAAGLPSNVPIMIGNDANLSAMAEYASGIAAGTSDLVYLTGEVGVGGGIVVGGKPLIGADGFAGEVGHIYVDPYGERCGCGRIGCWETKVGLAALVRMATPDYDYALLTRSDRDPEERLTEIERRRADGDQRVDEAIGEISRWLGRGASTLVHIFNPRVIVLGGYFARLADQIIPTAQAELERLSMPDVAQRCRFVPSDFGFGAAVRGAAEVVTHQVISDPMSFPRREIAS